MGRFSDYDANERGFTCVPMARPLRMPRASTSYTLSLRGKVLAISIIIAACLPVVLLSFLVK